MTASAWTQERIDRLKALWSEGQTADQIARDLANGISRSAVLGKVHRLGLSGGRASVKAKPRVGASAAPTSRPRPTVAARPEAGVAAERGMATLLSVRRCECRWPYGDPKGGDFSLCGRRVVRGVYCGPHAGIAYRGVRETVEGLERLARLN